MPTTRQPNASRQIVRDLRQLADALLTRAVAVRESPALTARERDLINETLTALELARANLLDVACDALRAEG